MLFSKDKNPAVEQPKRFGIRSALGVLLNPHVGSTVQPLRETTGIFINLLALIFASQGMFPRNHPALNEVPGARLTLSNVLGIAWKNLTFTKDKIPQVLLFFAVIASLGFSVIAVFAFALSLFVGKAHAASTFVSTCGGNGYFDPCDSTQDIALSWINYLFNAQPMNNYLGQFGQVIPQFTTVQTALISALAFYSNAILIVAAVILFYHLASMVVETAHHGQVMGKRANQIWAPIRLVVAIGLLVPIAGGLNSGQFIVIKVAEWGSNMASQVWNVFVTNLAAENYNGIPAVAPYVRKAVYDVVLMEACKQTYNTNLSGANGGAAPSQSNGPPPLCSSMQGGQCPTMQDPSSNQVSLSGGATMYIYDLPQGNTIQADKGICGHYIFPPTVTTSDNTSASTQNSVYNINQTAFDDMRQQAATYVQQHLTYFLPTSLGGQGDSSIPDNTGDIEQLVSDYQTALQNGLNNAAFSNASTNMASIANISSSEGWVSAGAWFNTVARMQAEMMDISGLVPGTQSPNLKDRSTQLFRQNVFPTVGQFQDWLDEEQPTGFSSGNTTSPQDQLLVAAAGIKQAGEKKPSQIMDKIFYFVDWVASWNKVWQSATPGYVNANSPNAAAQNFTLGVQFTGANPLAEIAYLGHANLNTAYDLFDFYLEYLGVLGTAAKGGKVAAAVLDLTAKYASVAGAAPAGVALLASLFGDMAETAVTAVGTIISFFCVLFFTSGVMLAFFLPLIPFFRFMFNILTWVVSLIEAVIAVPLIALAHLNPEGEGLPGATGKAAYHFVFSIFLRPVLMVFGLIAGLLIFFIAASYMNLLYTQAVVGTGGLAHGHLMLSRFVYSLLYVFVLYMAANSSFHMIDWLPEHAMKWMGGQSMHWQKMGDPSDLAQPMTLVTGYADSQIMQGVGKLQGPGAFALREGLSGRSLGDVPGDMAAAPGHFVDRVRGILDQGSANNPSSNNPGGTSPSQSGANAPSNLKGGASPTPTGSQPPVAPRGLQGGSNLPPAPPGLQGGNTPKN